MCVPVWFKLLWLLTCFTAGEWCKLEGNKCVARDIEQPEKPATEQKGVERQTEGQETEQEFKAPIFADEGAKKTGMNYEWRKWACLQLSRGISPPVVRSSLLKQRYSDEAIAHAMGDGCAASVGDVIGYTGSDLPYTSDRKQSMSLEWRLWTCKQLRNGVHRAKVEKELVEQRYSDEVISFVLNNCDRFDEKTKIAQFDGKQPSGATTAFAPDPEAELAKHVQYVLDKLATLELDANETRLLANLEAIRSTDLVERVKRKGLLVIDNWLEDDVADFLFSFFEKKTFHDLGSSNHNLKFYFRNINRDESINRVAFLFNRVFPRHNVFHGGVGFAHYNEGSHIEEHTDHGGITVDGVRHIRSISGVLYLTKDWEEEYGGAFHDLEDGKLVYPAFNRLVLFSVPHRHAVQKVMKDAGRYSLFFFFTVPENLYPMDDERFAPTTHFL